jgi:hypothetical protein
MKVLSMLAWVKKIAAAIKTPDGVALSAGILGFVLLVTGIALISIPVALIVAGALLMAWSALVAKAIATNGGGA